MKKTHNIFGRRLAAPLRRALPALAAATLLLSCMDRPGETEANELMARFNTTWNIHEECLLNDDGTITYKAVPWGGLVGAFLEHNVAMDLSAYESITIEFAEPTPVGVQLVVADRFKTWGKKGTTRLTCYFDGQDVRSVDKMILQAGDSCVLTVKDIYFTPNDAKWNTIPVWAGKCCLANWENGFVVKPEKFASAYEGDKLEFLFTADKSDAAITYWLLKTIYASTDKTLEGNSNELNEWGCAMISGEANIYRIILTATDVANLKEHGLFVNGYYLNITQVNLLGRSYAYEE